MSSEVPDIEDLGGVSDSKSDSESIEPETDPDAPPPFPEPITRFTEEITPSLLNFTKDLLSDQIPTTQKEYNDKHRKMRVKYRINPRKSTLLKIANADPKLPFCKFLVKKFQKSTSGVVVISIMTKPDKFSCKYDCHMCPKYPDYPRSYVPNEPTSQRAISFNFDCPMQLLDRCRSLRNNGHPIDKLEIIILGGTWSSYDDKYQELFIRDIYYAANIFEDWYNHRELRRRLTLEEEIEINQNSSTCHIIGMTPETRPDCINKKEIIKFRRFGFTRVQIGLQHTDDTILKKINRMCKTKHNIRGIKLLKESGFKVDIHLMLDLPDSTPEKDLNMVQEVIYSPEFQADHWKIYPTSVTNYTKISEWYKSGEYKPYSELNNGKELVDLILKIIPIIPEYIRVNRIFRDIPSHEIIGGANLPNLRQILTKKCVENNIRERDIRAREVKDRDLVVTPDNVPKFFIEKYNASDGIELFISCENQTKTVLYGFIRLRFNNKTVTSTHFLKPLRNAAIVRELHVYGSLIKVDSSSTSNSTQHKGIGKMLVAIAEQETYKYGLRKVAIIAGIGVRNYYKEKLGYHLEDTYMVKDISTISLEPVNFPVPPRPVRPVQPAHSIPTFDDIEWDALVNIWIFVLFMMLIYTILFK